MKFMVSILLKNLILLEGSATVLFEYLELVIPASPLITNRFDNALHTLKDLIECAFESWFSY